MSEDSQTIDYFKLIPFGEANFRTVQKKFFSKKKFQLSILLEWQAANLKIALLKTTSNSPGKSLFKLILGFMGDRELQNETKFEIGARIISMGIGKENVIMRDEIYCQVCKQVTFNPSQDATFEGWRLMRLLVNYFPPSRDLEPYLIEFFQEHLLLDKEYNGRVPEYAKHCLKMLEKISAVGAKGRFPTADEIDGLYNAPLISIFGSTLDDIMERQEEFAPDEELPLVLTSLAIRVLELDGPHTEGIFRIPGDAEDVATLKVGIENGFYDMSSFGINDAHSPASTLKLWMRELEEPIIPGEFYDEAIEYARDDEPEKSVQMIEKLPDINRLVVEYVIQYLRALAAEEYVEITMMSVVNLAMVFAPNFLRCPSDDPSVIFDTQKHQQTFVRHLIEEMEFEVDFGFEEYLQ